MYPKTKGPPIATIVSIIFSVLVEDAALYISIVLLGLKEENNKLGYSSIATVANKKVMVKDENKNDNLYLLFETKRGILAIDKIAKNGKIISIGFCFISSVKWGINNRV